jgi:membrane protease YdiL (CAAX protease family)
MATLRLVALALTAIILVPSGAHLFALPNKIGLDADAYFTIQGIYAGWALFAVPIAAAILANGALAIAERRRDPRAAFWALLSALLIIASLAVFFVWVFPGNRATENWTSVPDGWQALRRRWEYGHAANAAIVFAALLATGRAIMGSRREG